jgi:hypothetical protein
LTSRRFYIVRRHIIAALWHAFGRATRGLRAAPIPSEQIKIKGEVSMGIAVDSEEADKMDGMPLYSMKLLLKYLRQYREPEDAGEEESKAIDAVVSWMEEQYALRQAENPLATKGD